MNQEWIWAAPPTVDVFQKGHLNRARQGQLPNYSFLFYATKTVIGVAAII